LLEMSASALRWLGICLAAILTAARPVHADEASARAYYNAGATLYDAGEFDQAVAAFKEAFARSKAPRLLFNIAQAARRKGDAGCHEALDYYTRYANEMPGLSEEQRAEVIDRIDEMRVCSERQSPQVSTAVVPGVVLTAPSAAPQQRSFARRHWWIFPVGATLLVGAALGIGLGLSYGRSGNQLNCGSPSTLLCLRSTGSP
jgi:tetratricopeptide (TPR) repeat protein